jgi:hypothetical protein
VHGYVSSIKCRTNHNLLTSKISLENVETFKYLGTRVTNQNCIHEEQNKSGECLLPFNSVFCLSGPSLKTYTNIFKTIILPVVLYGWETCSLTLREEHKLRMFENRVLRRIFGPKREKLAGGLRRMHIEEPCNFKASPD